MTREFSRNSHCSVAVPFIEEAPSQEPSQEELTAAREAELLALFDRLPKWNTLEGGQVRHYYWNGEKWVEFDVSNPPLWAVENIDPDSLAAPGV